MTNAVVHKFERNQARIGKYLMGLLSGSFCVPEKQFKAIRSSNNRNVKGGFHLTEMFINDNGAPRTRYRRNVKAADGLALLGEGEDGTVFIGHYGDVKNDPVAIKIGNKVGLSTEYKIMKALEKISPHVQHPYFYKSPEQCAFERTKRKNGNPLLNQYPKGTGILYSEYAPGGSLNGFLGAFGRFLTPGQLKAIVFQVLWTLFAIQRKYPSFRHTDLHLENIFVDNTVAAKGHIEYKPNFVVPASGIRVIIGDFANSNIKKKGLSNPSFGNQHKNTHGIYPGMSALYDAHLFLTQFDEFTKHLPAAAEFRSFLKDCIPAAFMPTKDGKSAKLTEQRLRANSNADKKIPPLFGMLKHPYFGEYRTTALAGPNKYRWPHNKNVNLELKSKKVTEKRRRVVKRPLIKEEAVEVNAEYNEGIILPTLSEKIRGNKMENKRREMLREVLIAEKMAEFPNINKTGALKLVMAEARGEHLPKARGRPVGFQNYLKKRKLGVKGLNIGKLEPIVPKKVRSLNRKSPAKSPMKKAGSAPLRVNLSKMQPRKKKIALNKRRFLISSNNNKNVTLFNQMLELRKRGVQVPENMRMNAAPIKMMPKAKAKIGKLSGNKSFGPPANMTLQKQKKWWKEQLSVSKGYLTIGGKKCEAHPVAVVKTVMQAMGKKLPPKATKADLCRMIKMKVSGNNSNNNSNSNSNNNDNVPVKKEMVKKPALKVRSPITLSEARRRLRERTAAARAAKKQTKPGKDNNKMKAIKKRVAARVAAKAAKK